MEELTETEHLERCKPRDLHGPNAWMFVEIVSALRKDVDYGGWDGHGPDLLHWKAAAAIEDLIVALDSQIEICNDLRRQAALASRSANTAAPEDAKDAARYRHIRSTGLLTGGAMFCADSVLNDADDLDKAVDAAMLVARPTAGATPADKEDK